MVFDIIFCSYLNTIKWLQNHLITCPFKKLTGFDCPGCGFQRSVIALLKGDVSSSLQLYPATVLVLLIALFVIADKPFNTRFKYPVKKYLYVITCVVIVGSYFVKLSSYI